MYPNPYLLVVSVERLNNPPIEKSPVNVSILPSDPEEIERFVIEFVRYEYDFRVYGVPWYLPHPEEVIKNGKGDCKSRAILLASILNEKNIPFSFEISPIHFWVDYEGKEQTDFVKKFENQSAAIYVDGKWKFPEYVDLHTYMDVWKTVLWDSMPFVRKVLLISGIVSIWFYPYMDRLKKIK